MSNTPDVKIREWFEELWNAGREETVDRLLAPHGTIHGLPTPGGRPLVGPKEFKAYYHQLRGAFPDIHVSIERMLTQGELVAVHCRVTGTHKGDGLGIPATNRPVDFSGMCIARWVDQHFIEGWNAFDFLTCYQQLGVVPPLPG